MIVSVPERGVAEIGSEDWASLRDDSRFRRLVEDKILFVEGLSGTTSRLRGSCYVGRASIGDRILEVREKFPGALAALVGYGALEKPLIERIPSPVDPTTRSTAILVAMFLTAARIYLSNWKATRYTRVPDEGALIGGRLDIVKTASLRARGLRHKAAFDHTVLSADVPLNRCVYGALCEIERLAEVVEIPLVQVAQARALRLGLSECLTHVLKARSGELAEVAATCAEDMTYREEMRDVASLAGAVLDAAGFGGTNASSRTVARSWFVNLENLFEKAVRNLIRLSLAEVAVVSSAKKRPPLFTRFSDRYCANPDIVIRQGETVVAVADAKYKDFADWPSAPDVHQILAHASAYDAAKAMLFYPVERQTATLDFGVSTTGCRLLMIGVSLADAAADIGYGLKEAGFGVGS